MYFVYIPEWYACTVSDVEAPSFYHRIFVVPSFWPCNPEILAVSLLFFITTRTCSPCIEILMNSMYWNLIEYIIPDCIFNAVRICLIYRYGLQHKNNICPILYAILERWVWKLVYSNSFWYNSFLWYQEWRWSCRLPALLVIIVQRGLPWQQHSHARLEHLLRQPTTRALTTVQAAPLACSARAQDWCCHLVVVGLGTSVQVVLHLQLLTTTWWEQESRVLAHS